VEVGNGVTVIGAGNLPAQMPVAASTAYARNVAATLGEFVRDGGLTIDLADELQAAIVVAHAGQVQNPAVRALLDEKTAVAMAFAAMNVVGGYMVTDRMLHMFRRRQAAAPAPPAPPADLRSDEEAAAR